MASKLRFRAILHDGDPAAIRAMADNVGIFSPEQVALVGQLAETTLDQSNPYRWLLAERDGALAGFICFDRSDQSRVSFDLYWIAVSADQQKQGLGRELIARTAKVARSKGGIQLFAETSSRPAFEGARRFYAACGFELVATLADFYAVDEDRLVMRLRLSAADADSAE